MSFRKALPSSLSYPVRFSVVGKYLGLMLLISTGTIGVPLIVSLITKEYSLSVRYAFLFSVFLVLGVLSTQINKPKHLQSNEAFVIIALTFIINSLALAYPTMLTGLNFTDAWFETISGITTTGLSVANLKQIENKTFFFSRAWMQWYGGLGIIIFSLGLAFQPRHVSKQLYDKISTDHDLLESSKAFARKMVIIYVTLTIFGFLLLISLNLPLMDAISLAFSSISTGGFSPYPNSLASLAYSVQACILLLSFLGALPFFLFWISGTDSIQSLLKNQQMRWLIVLIIFFTLLFNLLFSGSWDRFLPKAFLNVVSLQTTAGFSTFDFSELNASSKILLVASMFIGGSSQSTAGGIKIVRLLLVMSTLRILFYRTTLPKHGVFKDENQKDVNACFSLLALYFIYIFASLIIFVSYGYDPLDSLFDIISATGTVGASSGITSPNLPNFLKYVLSFNMLLGRLEFITLLVLFYPKTLIGRRMKE